MANPSGEVAMRREVVKELILQGKPTFQIIQTITKDYGIGLKSVEKDITLAYRELKKYAEKHKEDIVSEHIGKYDKIYEQCMKLGDFRDALKAIRQKEELLKYHRADPLIAIQNNTMNLENVTNDMLIKSIEELKSLTNEE